MRKINPSIDLTRKQSLANTYANQFSNANKTTGEAQDYRMQTEIQTKEANHHMQR